MSESFEELTNQGEPLGPDLEPRAIVGCNTAPRFFTRG